MHYEFNEKGFYIKVIFEKDDLITIWENDGFLKRNSYYIKSMNDEEVILGATIPSIRPESEVRKVMDYFELATRIRLYLLKGIDRHPERSSAWDIELLFGDHEQEEVEEVQQQSGQLSLF